MYNKNTIDAECEKEAIALKKQCRCTNSNYKRVRVQKDYNVDSFNRLFVKNKYAV